MIAALQQEKREQASTISQFLSSGACCNEIIKDYRGRVHDRYLIFCLYRN